MTSRPTLDVDPFDEAVLAAPLQLHTAIREAGPVVWIPKYGFWATGRDAEVREVFSDWDRFSSASGTGLTNIKTQSAWRKPSAILEVDPPDHTVTRRVLARVLSPSAMRQLRDDFQVEADRLIDELVERGRFDAAQDLSFRFPFTVLPDAVGLQRNGRHHLVPYANLNFNAQGPPNRLVEQATLEAADSLEYVRWQCDRANLIPGRFGAQIYAAADAGEIDEETAALLVRTFLSAGIDTTVYAIGLMLYALITHPDQWARLRVDRALAKKAFEETLRYTPSSPLIGRTTTGATELGGVALGESEKVICFLGAANRDPRKWNRADDFDIGRYTGGQLAFGMGPHFCVGHAIARLEAECLLTAVVERIERIEIAGPPVSLTNNWLRGYTSLPVVVTPS